jgi:hypothetical protein
MGIQKNFDLTEISSQPILTQRDSTVTTLIVIGNICFTILKQMHFSIYKGNRFLNINRIYFSVL